MTKAGPEHFAVIANRHFVRLKEIPMLDPTSPIGGHFTELDQPEPKNAEAHYRLGEALLTDAKAEKVDYARSHRLAFLAQVHYTAAIADAAIWPPRHDSHLVAENQAMAQELVRLLPVAQAAREYLATETGAGVAYDELAAAVKKLEGGE